jgi:hypothetical protein
MSSKKIKICYLLKLMTNHEYDSYEIYATSHFLLLHEFFLLHDSIP